MKLIDSGAAPNALGLRDCLQRVADEDEAREHLATIAMQVDEAPMLWTRRYTNRREGWSIESPADAPDEIIYKYRADSNVNVIVIRAHGGDWCPLLEPRPGADERKPPRVGYWSLLPPVETFEVWVGAYEFKEGVDPLIDAEADAAGTDLLDAAPGGNVLDAIAREQLKFSEKLVAIGIDDPEDVICVARIFNEQCNHPPLRPQAVNRILAQAMVRAIK